MNRRNVNFELSNALVRFFLSIDRSFWIVFYTQDCFNPKNVRSYLIAMKLTYPTTQEPKRSLHFVEHAASKSSTNIFGFNWSHFWCKAVLSRLTHKAQNVYPRTCRPIGKKEDPLVPSMVFTKSGWFESQQLEKWFKEKKLLIGD